LGDVSAASVAGTSSPRVLMSMLIDDQPTKFLPKGVISIQLADLRRARGI